MCPHDPQKLDYLEEGVRGDPEGQPQQVLIDASVSSHVLQGQALLTGSLSVDGGVGLSVSGRSPAGTRPTPTQAPHRCPSSTK